jgi:acetyltransferase
VRDLSHRFIARLTQIDDRRAIALVAIDPSSGEKLGVVRLYADANYDRGEYAILVRLDLLGRLIRSPTKPVSHGKFPATLETKI